MAVRSYFSTIDFRYNTYVVAVGTFSSSADLVIEALPRHSIYKDNFQVSPNRKTVSWSKSDQEHGSIAKRKNIRTPQHCIIRIPDREEQSLLSIPDAVVDLVEMFGNSTSLFLTPNTCRVPFSTRWLISSTQPSLICCIIWSGAREWSCYETYDKQNAQRPPGFLRLLAVAQ